MAGPHTPFGAVANRHHPQAGPLTGAEIAWASHRPGDARTELPAAGDLVGLREREGGPVLPATVLQVLDSLTDPPAVGGFDPNVWQVVVNPVTRAPSYGPDGRYLLELVPDPWPRLLVRVDPVDGKGQRKFIEAREARLLGSAGWLPRERMRES